MPRPKAPKGTTKDSQLQIRVNARLKSIIQEHCENNLQVSVSEYVTRLVKQDMNLKE